MVAVYVGPAVLDLAGIRAGDTNAFDFLLHYAGTPMDLTGATVTAEARRTPADDVVAVAAVCTITDAAGGRVRVAWDGEAVRALMPNPESTWAGVWDLQVAGPGMPPAVDTLAGGKFTAEMDVARP